MKSEISPIEPKSTTLTAKISVGSRLLVAVRRTFAMIIDLLLATILSSIPALYQLYCLGHFQPRLSQYMLVISAAGGVSVLIFTFLRAAYPGYPGVEWMFGNTQVLCGWLVSTVSIMTAGYFSFSNKSYHSLLDYRLDTILVPSTKQQESTAAIAVKHG